MGSTRRAFVLATALALMTGACGDDDATPVATEATTGTTAAAATTTAAPTTTTAAPTVTAIVDMPYKWGDEMGDATQDELPFPLGTIEAHWYQAGDRYAVVYVGLDLEESGPLCPGNSILGADGFAHVTNSPSPGASCEGSGATIIGPPIGTQVCGGLVSYLTEIPVGTMGTLYASIEVYPGTGIFYGASSMVEADPDYMAEIDPAILGC